jgi:RHS repeat-associated protein
VFTQMKTDTARRMPARPTQTKRPAAMAALVLMVLGAACPADPARAQGTPERTVRSVQYEYDPVTGVVTLERIDPGLSGCVEKAYRHDAYGNRERTEVRPCAGATSAEQRFEARVTEAGTAAPPSQTGLPVPSANIHAAGAYTTQLLSKDASGKVLSKTTAVYDTRFGTVSRQAEVGLNASVGALTEYDGFGRVLREISPVGTAVQHRRVYCQGAYFPVTPACIRYESSLTVEVASGMLHDAMGNPTNTVGLRAFTAYYVESTPYDKNGAVMGGRVRTHYDSLHREIARESEAYDLRWVRTLKAYDQLGLVSASWGPHFVPASGGTVAPPPELRQWASEYDAQHRAVKQVRFVQNSEGAEPVERSATVAYRGLEVTSTTPPGGATGDGPRTHTTRKNATGQTVQTVDTYGATVTMAYDAMGQLRKTVGALGSVTTLEYTPGTSRFKQAMNDPNAGRWTYAHDALGQLTRQTDAKAQSTQMSYDALGRMVAKANPTLNASWHYDKGTDGNLCADGLSRLCEVVAGNTVTRRERLAYDTLGRVRSSTSILDRAYTTEFLHHESTGALKQVFYPTGFSVKYHYSGTGSGKLPGILEQVADAANASRVFWRIDTLAPSTVFDAQGHLLRSQLGNGVLTRSAYDAIGGKPLSLQAGPAGSPLSAQNSAYGYDAHGNLLVRSDGGMGLAENFAYDRLDRLVGYDVHSASDASARRSVAVGYNAAGNILSKSDVGGYTYTASDGPLPHAVRSAGGTHYTYDANGSLTGTTGVQQRSNTWTAFNQPERLSQSGRTVDFLYDAGYKRIQERVTANGTVRTTWMVHPDNAGGLGFEREETYRSGTLVRNENRHYISVGGSVVAVVKTDNAPGTSTLNGTVSSDPNKTLYWHKDALGSVVGVSNAAGAVVERMGFDAWGRRMAATGNASTPQDPAHGDRGYTGHEHLDEVGLVHMNGRVYDPALGRFFSVDPQVQSPGDLQNHNRYTYVLNNPLKYTDPSGECFMGLDTAVCAAAFVVGVAMVQEGNKYWRVVGQLLMIMAMSSSEGLIESGLGEVSQVYVSEAACIGTQPFAAGAIPNSMLSAAIATAATPGTNTSDVVSSAVFAAAFNTAGGVSAGPSVQKFAAHVLLGCVQGAMSGGACGPSTAAAFVGKGITEGLPEGVDDVTRGLTTAIAGGTASVIGGGKFANGAYQAGFGYLFNHLMSKAATRNFFSLSRGHHPFTAQWGAEYRAYVSDDAIAFLGASTMGAEVRWEGDHPNKYPGENGAHKEYNEHTGRRAVLNFFERNGVSAERPLTLDQARQLDTELRRLEFNREMQKYIDVQRTRGRFNLRGMPKGGMGQPQD